MELALETKFFPRRRRAGLTAAGALLALVALTLAVSQVGAAPSAPSAPLPAGSKNLVAGSKNLVAAYGRLPVSFVPNVGQAASGIRYTARGAGYSFAFTSNRVLFSFAKARSTQTLALEFLDANPRVRVQARERLGGTVNYFVGSDRSKWHTGLATYREVIYPNIWPRIDMVWHGARGTLEYEFLVRPGARVQDMRLAYRGATRLSLDTAGDLHAATRLGVLTDSRPVSYQRIEGRRVPVQSRYVLGRMGAYGFALGTRYDARYPIVIDPGLRYSTFLGGTGLDVGFDIAVDEAGNAYVAGYTGSANFPTTPGAFQPANAGNLDAFVTKLNRSGSALIYSTYLGGSDVDIALGVAVDEGGNAYVAGQTDSSGFPTTPGAFQATDPDPTPGDAGSEGFVTKLNPSGSALVYSTYIGGTSGSSGDSLNGIAVNGDGNAYVAGSVCTSTYPTTAHAFQPTDPTPGPCDPTQDRPTNNTAVVSELNPSGSALVYSTYLGGTSFDNINSLAIDAKGNVYLTGPVDGAFPTTPGAFQASDPAPGTDAFVTKLNRSGSALVYSTYLGGSSTDEGGLGIGVDDNGFAYVAGRTGSTDFPLTPGAYDTTLSGEDDAFVTKLNRSGSALVYSTLLGGSGIEEPGFSVAIDGDGRVSVQGVTNSIDFPTTPGAVQPAYGGGSFDAFVTTLNRSGSALDYSTYLGGSGRDIGNGLALDDEGMVYVTGSTRSSNFPTTPGAFETTHNSPGIPDAFVTKLELPGSGQ